MTMQVIQWEEAGVPGKEHGGYCRRAPREWWAAWQEPGVGTGGGGWGNAMEYKTPGISYSLMGFLGRKSSKSNLQNYL